MAGFGDELLILRGPTGVTDQSGTGNDGTYIGGMGVIADTDSGGVSAFQFDGANDYIQLPVVQSDLPLTLAAWVKVDTQASFAPFVGIYSSSSGVDWRSIGHRNSGTTNSHIVSRSSVALVFCSPGTALGTHTWRLVVGVFRSTTDRELYIDGVSVSTSSTSSSPTGLDRASIGYNWDSSPSNFFNGRIDDVRILSRALTAGEISSWYAGGRGFDSAVSIYAVNGKAPIAAWIPSRDTVGNGTTTLTDLVGPHDGTLTDMDAASDWVADTGNGGVRALDFDGINDRVIIADADAFSFTDGAGQDLPFSFSAWLFLRGYGGSSFPIAPIIAKYSQFSPEFLGEWMFYVQNTGNLELQVLSGTTSTRLYKNTTATIATNQWVHVGCSYDGSETHGGMRLYINGIEVGTVDTGANHTGVSNRTGPVSIGSALFDGFAAYRGVLDGRLDDMRVYARVIDASEFTHLATARGVLGDGETSGVTADLDVTLDDATSVTIPTVTLTPSSRRIFTFVDGAINEVTSGHDLAAGNNSGNRRSLMVFTLPSDFMGATINSATFSIGAWHIPGSGEPGRTVLGIPANTVSAASQDILNCQLGTSLRYMADSLYVSEYPGNQVDATLETNPGDVPTTSLSVQAMMAEAMAAGRFSGGTMQLVWRLNDAPWGLNGYLQLGANPELTITYTPAPHEAALSYTLDEATIEATGDPVVSGELSFALDAATLEANAILTVDADLAVTLGDCVTSTTGVSLQLFGDVQITLDAATIEATAGVVIAADLAIALDDTSVLSLGSAPLFSEAIITLDAVTIASSGFAGDSLVGEVAITLNDAAIVAAAQLDSVGLVSLVLSDVSVVAVGSTAIVGSLAVTLASVSTSASGIVRPKRRDRGLFPSNLFLDSQFVG